MNGSSNARNTPATGNGRKAPRSSERRSGDPRGGCSLHRGLNHEIAWVLHAIDAIDGPTRPGFIRARGRTRHVYDLMPAGLDALAPDWIDPLPADVIAGVPLLYRRLPAAGHVLCSRGLKGLNGLDGLDGGGTVGDASHPADWVGAAAD